MVYIEIKERNGKKYYYSVLSVRKGEKISKIRKYLGVNLSKKSLILKEKKASNEFKLIKKDRDFEKMKKKIIAILVKNKIRKAGIFGSYARGDPKKNSDVDILMQPPKGIGFGVGGIKIELEEKLKKKIHLITYKYIHPRLKEEILKEEIKLL